MDKFEKLHTLANAISSGYKSPWTTRLFGNAIRAVVEEEDCGYFNDFITVHISDYTGNSKDDEMLAEYIAALNPNVVKELLDKVAPETCHLCGGSGDIHTPDGEWRGECPYHGREMRERERAATMVVEVMGSCQSVPAVGHGTPYYDPSTAEVPPPRHPLQKLGEYLSSLLDEDEWATAEQHLLAAWAEQSVPVVGEPAAAWQFYQDGKWWNGMDGKHRGDTEEAGIPVRNLFPEVDAITRARLDELLAAENRVKELGQELQEQLLKNCGTLKERNDAEERVQELEEEVRELRDALAGAADDLASASKDEIGGNSGYEDSIAHYSALATSKGGE